MTMLHRQASLGYQVNHLARLLENRLRDQIAHTGVKPGQFAQMLALYEEDNLTQHELCERVGIDQSTMAHTLRRMERDGLISRTVDPDDRRRSRNKLTDHARELEPELTELARQVNTRATTDIPAEEIEAFMATLARIIADLERH